jgi:hypothetical protein
VDRKNGDHLIGDERPYTALAVFGAMVVTAQAATPSPGEVSHQSPGYSDRATAADYQQLFNAMVQQHRYPRVVEGKVFNGIVLYHAAFEPYPAGGFSFWSHHGITPDVFAQKNDQYRRDGFRLVHKQSVHLAGREFVQATWVSTAHALSALQRLDKYGMGVGGRHECDGRSTCSCRVQQCGDIPVGKPSPVVAACMEKCMKEKEAARR